MSAEHLSAEQLARKVEADEARPARPIEPPVKSPHELFMEAAAVETLAATLVLPERWMQQTRKTRRFYFAEARRLITESMEGQKDG